MGVALVSVDAVTAAAASSTPCCRTDVDASDARLRSDLIREGRCPDCGRQTHQLHYNVQKMNRVNGGLMNAVVVHKEPLTVGKEVLQGRCLLCLRMAAPVYERHDSGSSGGSTGSIFDYDAMLAVPQHNQPQQQQQILSPPALVRQLPQPQQLHAISEENDFSQQHQESKESTSHSSAQQDIINPEEDESCDTDDNEIFSILCRMRRHPKDLSVQISSFHALWVLSWETDNARAIGHVGGIPILLQSLRYHLNAHLTINNRYNRNNHTSSPSSLQQMQLQSNGLATLQNLSVNKYNKELLVSDEHRGIPLLLLSMRTFSHNAEIQRSGCHALANILSNGGCYKLGILQKGGLAAVTGAVEMHQDNEGVVRAAYKCLSLLGQKQSNLVRKGFQRMEGRGCCDNMTDDEVSNGGEDVSMMGMDVSARSAASEHTL